MSELKPGMRLRSAVSDVEVVVVKAPAAPVDLRCGGRSMVGLDVADGEPTASVAGSDGAALLGKRYTGCDGDLEVLCSKAGAGALSIGDTPLEIKGAKPLPSSD